MSVGCTSRHKHVSRVTPVFYRCSHSRPTWDRCVVITVCYRVPPTSSEYEKPREVMLPVLCSLIPFVRPNCPPPSRGQIPSSPLKGVGARYHNPQRHDPGLLCDSGGKSDTCGLRCTSYNPLPTLLPACHLQLTWVVHIPSPKQSRYRPWTSQTPAIQYALGYFSTWDHCTWVSPDLNWWHFFLLSPGLNKDALCRHFEKWGPAAARTCVHLERYPMAEHQLMARAIEAARAFVRTFRR